jgi:hypothetical protein
MTDERLPMHARKRWFALAVAALACAAGQALAQPGTGRLQEDYLGPLLRTSCPADAKRMEPESIDLKTKRVLLQGVNPGRKTLGELTFVDGFHLTSPDKRFGGLSGIDVLDDGNLLAVSDAGDFVWIGLGADGVTPVSARISGMRDASGDALQGKVAADAEGLAVEGGVALVSFEGDHRVLAFDLGRCGAAARGAPVAGAHGEFGAAFRKANLKVGGNEGPEALALAPGWFMFVGLEARTDNASAISARAIEAPLDFSIRVGESAPSVVGLDVLPRDDDGLAAYSLHRSTNAMATNVIVLVETLFARDLDQANLPARIISDIDERSRARFRPAASRVLAGMNLFVTIDNFEGVAARRMPDGRVRLYVVADDNFSASQRTLLMVYDVAEQG